MPELTADSHTFSPQDRIITLLQQLYSPEQAIAYQQQIIAMLGAVKLKHMRADHYFSERNITLITYGDTLQHPGEAPLQTLHHFLKARLKDVITTVHILPFYPYSSDDGFSVIDYYAVNPALGTWDDIQHLSSDFRLMFDAVINHMSAKSEWFKAFLADNNDYTGLFRTENPETDLSSVTRPRTSPLLTAFKKVDGSTVHVWTTFSADQVDLDYSRPETLLRILKVLLFYVEQGASVIRLDAIAYMWKEAGTSSIHLPQTHAIIQLMRAALDVVAPEVILITETNVPHPENISYFGTNAYPEAQLVYNFTLPPLLFYTLTVGDAYKLSNWINTLSTKRERTTFFNFTASHDGIGVRPVEGILNATELQQLIDKVESSGGLVSYKANSDGSRSPYELNITYVDAIIDHNEPVAEQVARFLVSQAIMLTLAGVPAIYIHSLIGSHNDLDGVQKTGHARAINRRKVAVTEVSNELDDATSFRAQVFSGYTHMINVRMQCSAFHPSGKQLARTLADGQVLILERNSPDHSEHVLCLFNISPETATVETPFVSSTDLLTQEHCEKSITLSPYETRWLKPVS
ncbi:MAG: sugar phosphorylase [Anaerolineaceae bacterium]|nr:sugar phosphorylase [Anaerolineaceae bacterium]